jgi:hypothetical protein
MRLTLMQKRAAQSTDFVPGKLMDGIACSD